MPLRRVSTGSKSKFQYDVETMHLTGSGTQIPTRKNNLASNSVKLNERSTHERKQQQIGDRITILILSSEPL